MLVLIGSFALIIGGLFLVTTIFNMIVQIILGPRNPRCHDIQNKANDTFWTATYFCFVLAVVISIGFVVGTI